MVSCSNPFQILMRFSRIFSNDICFSSRLSAASSARLRASSAFCRAFSIFSSALARAWAAFSASSSDCLRWRSSGVSVLGASYALFNWSPCCRLSSRLI